MFQSIRNIYVVVELFLHFSTDDYQQFSTFFDVANIDFFYVADVVFLCCRC
jgi:hypothetical protein